MKLDLELQSKIHDIMEQCYQQGYRAATMDAMNWMIRDLPKNVKINYGPTANDDDHVHVTAEGLNNYQQYMES